jgi:Tfp pilus assembly protein PilF
VSRVSCRQAALAGLIFIAALLPCGCSRKSAPPSGRLAILRFENLGDPSADWMGRAFSDILTGSLGRVSGMTVITPERLHGLNATLGPRPVTAPGISSERELALVAGATRIGYGDYSAAANRVEARLTIEDQATGKTTQVLSASGPDVLAAARALARAISPAAVPYGTRSVEAMKAWVAAQEGADPEAAGPALERALAADADFGPAYRALAEWKAQHRDISGAAAVLERALARGAAITEIERARIEVQLAGVRNDPAGRERALEALLKLDPRSAAEWRVLGQSAFGRRAYARAAQAYQNALRLEPGDLNAENQLAYAAAYSGDFDTAMAALKRYRAQSPGDANALDSMGDVNLIAGRLREAEGYYLDALKLNPGFLNQIDLLKAAMTRLMTGDVAGADALAKKYTGARSAAHDPLSDYRGVEWLWISGRRKAACTQMEALARAAESGAPALASQAYAELAIWKLMLGDRTAAAEQAAKATTGAAVIARFLAQPQASAAEWSARADRLFANAPQIRDVALVYALLLDSHFQQASELLDHMYDEGAGYLLAWSLTQTGRLDDAAPLLRANPVPPATGIGPTMSFYFPRIYYLRAVLAEKQGKAEDARANYRLFLTLSGDAPLQWGEEQKARAAAGM